MKKIINGRKYGTNTAALVAECHNEYGPGDFHYYYEELYRKRTGEYFIYGCGGPLSKYAKPLGYSGSCGADDFIPLTEDEARRWGERHMSVDEYETEFGKVEE